MGPAEFRKYLEDEIATTPEHYQRWVMTPACWTLAQIACDSSVTGAGATLYGYPVEVRDDGGLPHLVP